MINTKELIVKESYNLMINVHESKSQQNRFLEIVSFQTNSDLFDVTSIIMRKIANQLMIERTCQKPPQ